LFVAKFCLFTNPFGSNAMPVLKNLRHEQLGCRRMARPAIGIYASAGVKPGKFSAGNRP
jgi:hypothetical protein